jgi:thermostable 8-oxoguanine DNA glycosylase
VLLFSGERPKQASHFLFSLGFEGYAVIDSYILNKLVEFQLISKKPKNLTSSRYFAIEQQMEHWCDIIGIPLHFLDMLWWRGGIHSRDA